MVYGKQKVNFDIDGIELLAKAEGLEDPHGLASSRILTDEDLKKIKYLKLKQALKGVVKDKDEGEQSQKEESEEYSDYSDQNDDDDQEEGEEEIEESQDEEESKGS